MENRKTHFEEIPLEIVKKIADSGSTFQDGRAKKREWQQVAAELAEERDPVRLIALAKELNDALEERTGFQQRPSGEK
jgi:hypothetical protein